MFYYVAKRQKVIDAQTSSKPDDVFFAESQETTEDSGSNHDHQTNAAGKEYCFQSLRACNGSV